jgi:predicted Rossmann-fold nucleotide-binding protein
VPTPPPTKLLLPFDGSHNEVESIAELAAHLADGSLAGLTVQGLRLDRQPPDLSRVDVTDTLFVGCRFASLDVALDLVRRGASVIPEFAGIPYPSHPSRLYTPDDLADGFTDGGFDAMFDSRVYRHFVGHNGAAAEIREALAQRLHDSGIDDALVDETSDWAAHRGGATIVGIMGGHAETRGSAAYRTAAAMGWHLARAGRLVLTGGGPGVMEAANLGSYLSGYAPDDLAQAIDLLAVAPDFHDATPYTRAALNVRRMFPAGSRPWQLGGGLSIPTWLYGHEPANLFAGRIAKYFSNATREDIILRLARGGLVFAPGRAGTVQEVFQAATKTYYRTDGDSGPFVFLGSEFWTSTVAAPVLLRALLADSPGGDQSGGVHVTDDVAEAVRLLTGGVAGPPAARRPTEEAVPR